MKRLILAFALLGASMAMHAITHTVARGESLTSIAEQYHVTVAQLVDANPGVENLFFVGLKLNIPEVQAQAATSNAVEPAAQNYMVLQGEQVTGNDNNGISYNDTEDDDKPGIEAAMTIGYGFIPKLEGSNGGSCWTMNITWGVNYFFMHRNSGLFAGAQIGYANGSISDKYGNYSLSLDSHFISLPISIGYAITTADKKMGLVPYAGIDVNFCVSAKVKYKSESQKVDKKVGMIARVGAKFRLWGFDIGGAYNIQLNDNQKLYFGDDNYFSIDLGFGF